MSLNIGINNKKTLKNLRKMTKIPKKSYNNYYSYKHNIEPSTIIMNMIKQQSISFLIMIF